MDFLLFLFNYLIILLCKKLKNTQFFFFSPPNKKQFFIWIKDTNMQNEVCNGVIIDWEMNSFTNTSSSKRIYDLLGHFNGK